MKVVASLSQGLTAAAQCGLFTYKSVPVIFEPPYIYIYIYVCVCVCVCVCAVRASQRTMLLFGRPTGESCTGEQSPFTVRLAR